MKAGIGFCRRPLLGALAVGLLVAGTSTFGQEMRFQPTQSAPGGSAPGTLGSPISAPFNAALNCYEYSIDAGGEQVTITILAEGWGAVLVAGVPTQLGAMSAAMKASAVDGFSNAANEVGNHLVPVGWPGGDPLTRPDGAYQISSVCSDDGFPCVAPFALSCVGGGNFCIPNTQFFTQGFNNPINAVATPSIDYAWGAVSVVGVIADDRGLVELGTLVLEVPTNASGTYVIEIDTDPNFSSMTTAAGGRLPGVVFVDACITITTGSCCTDIGLVTADCRDGLTAADCVAIGGPIFRPNVTCADEDCPACTNDGECDDSDACTDDSCNLATFICSNSLNYDTAVDCCDSSTGGLTTIDDGDVCTGTGPGNTDVCNADGTVTRDDNTAPCDDDNDCTVEDTCDAGVCAGHDVNGDPCTTDADCRVGLCAGTACECLLCTPLIIDIDPGSAWDPNCFAVGEIVSAQIALGPGGSEDLFGGQFLLEYDESCVELLSVASCPGTPFPAIIEWEAGGGQVWWASTTDPGSPVATKGPNDIVCMEFRKLPGCDGCDMCFASINPRNTILTNSTGNPVAQCTPNNCSKVFRERGVIDLATPPDAENNADCGLSTSVVLWDSPSASDSCDGPLTVTCVAAHDTVPLSLFNPNALTNTGGEFPQGTTFYRCEATNSCHDTSVSVWTVDVSELQGLHVEVELTGSVHAGAFTRAITFELFDNACSDPVVVCEPMSFSGPFNFPGHARSWLKTPKGNYLCISAKDHLHTLRSCAAIECVDNAWSATWKGDAVLGGNGLVGGNLDCWKPDGNGNTIDVLDAGIYLGIIARNDPAELSHSANTSCGQAGPDGDINADGVTDSADYSFILDNFLRASKICCCDSTAAGDTAITSITIKELRRRGFPELVVADINGDGVLDTEDMALYMEGQLPVIPQKSHKRAASNR